MAYYYDWEGNPINATQWAQLFEDERHIGDDRIGDAHISTVWVGIDHRFTDDGPPLIFETMVFGGEFDEQTERYVSERAARIGHQRWVKEIQQATQAK